MSKIPQSRPDEEPTEKYLAWASTGLEAEADEGCESPGCSIIIENGGPYRSSDFGNEGDRHLDFGDTEESFI